MSKTVAFSDDEKLRMKMLYEGGLPLNETASDLGRSLYGVYYALKRMGVRIRSQSEGQKGKKYPFKARGKRSEEFRIKMSTIAKSRGVRHNFYVDGNGRDRYTERRRESDSFEYRFWRESVFRRDDFICQSCSVRGGRLHADHIKPWSTHVALRYVVENGRTLCEKCHRQTPTYGRSMISEVTAY